MIHQTSVFDSVLIEQLRKARTAAEVAALIPQMQQARLECHRELNALEDSREDAVFKDGTEFRAIKERIREQQEQLSDWDTAMHAADRRHEEFKTDELNCMSPKELFDLLENGRAKFIDTILELTRLRDQDKALRKSIDEFSKRAIKAGCKDLVPRDEEAEQFAAAGLPYNHPVNYPDWDHLINEILKYVAKKGKKK